MDRRDVGIRVKERGTLRAVNLLSAATAAVPISKAAAPAVEREADPVALQAADPVALQVADPVALAEGKEEAADAGGNLKDDKGRESWRNWTFAWWSREIPICRLS